MSNLWFTADLHFGHARILEYCAGRAKLWSTVEEMNRGLIERWNEVVSPGDTVVILGDVAMGKRSETLPYLKQCHGTKVLVPGNHDNCWEHGRDGLGSENLAKHTRDYCEWGGIDQIWGNGVKMLLDNRQQCVLSHLPPLECGDHKAGEIVYENEVRFAHLRPPYPEGWMLCGHVHEAWKQHGRVVNVGVDVWDYQPVAATTLIELIEKGESLV